MKSEMKQNLPITVLSECFASQSWFLPSPREGHLPLHGLKLGGAVVDPQSASVCGFCGPP